MAQGFAKTLKGRRDHKTTSGTTSVNSNPVQIAAGFSAIWTGLRRPSQAQGWSRGYNGPGKGTW